MKIEAKQRLMAARLSTDQQVKFLKGLQNEVPMLKGLNIKPFMGVPSFWYPLPVDATKSSQANAQEFENKLKELAQQLNKLGWWAGLRYDQDFLLVRKDETWGIGLIPDWKEANPKTGVKEHFIVVKAPIVDRKTTIFEHEDAHNQLAKIAKQILPRGFYKDGRAFTWRTDPGRGSAGLKTLSVVIQKAEAAGFKHLDSKSYRDPDRRTTKNDLYSSPEGFMLTVSSMKDGLYPDAYKAVLIYEPAYKD